MKLNNQLSKWWNVEFDLIDLKRTNLFVIHLFLILAHVCCQIKVHCKYNVIKIWCFGLFIFFSGGGVILGFLLWGEGGVFIFCDTLISCSIPFGDMSDNLWFIAYRSTICYLECWIYIAYSDKSSYSRRWLVVTLHSV